MRRRSAEIVRDTHAYAVEDRARTWRELGGTLGLVAVAGALVILVPVALKPVGTVLMAMGLVRLFIFVHDTAHGAIFREDPIGRFVMGVVGMYTLNALPIWSDGHDHHHATNGRPLPVPIEGIRLGDLVNRTVTVEQWGRLPEKDRRLMRILRHPLVLFGGFFTVFLAGQCLAPLLRNPARRGWALLALLTSSAVLVGVAVLVSPVDALFAVLLPQILGSGFGVYLFYAQHNYPAARLVDRDEDWDPIHAALDASSFFEMPGWLHWVTGNIGYHHVHHVNHRIPFYRLPEAMRAIPELQSPGRTSFRPSEMRACLRCAVWCPEEGRLVSFAEADAKVLAASSVPAAP